MTRRGHTVAVTDPRVVSKTEAARHVTGRAAKVFPGCRSTTRCYCVAPETPAARSAAGRLGRKCSAANTRTSPTVSSR